MIRVGTLRLKWKTALNLCRISFWLRISNEQAWKRSCYNQDEIYIRFTDIEYTFIPSEYFQELLMIQLVTYVIVLIDQSQNLFTLACSILILFNPLLLQVLAIAWLHTNHTVYII